jgi:hypothetical protein
MTMGTARSRKIVVLLSVVLAVLAVKSFLVPGARPPASLSISPASSAADKHPGTVRHQPTILQAESGDDARAMASPRHPGAADGDRDFGGDERFRDSAATTPSEMLAPPPLNLLPSQ